MTALKIFLGMSNLLVGATFDALLTFEGYKVVSSTSREAALADISRIKPDAIIADRYIGEFLLPLVRDDPQLAATIFIITSAPSGEGIYQDIRGFMDMGVDDYVKLPVTFSDLQLSLQSRLLRRAQILGLSQNGLHPTIKRLEHHVFLSYSRKDTIIMQRIRDDLRQRQITLWTDEDLKPGTPAWATAIQNAIENAGCIVVILSPDAKQSEWVNIELGYAKTYSVHCFPVLARGTDRDAIPISLINAQFSDIRSNYDAQLEKLVSAIRDHVGIIG